MNESTYRPLASLPTEALEEAYQKAKDGDSEKDARMARLISRELIRRKMQPAKEETK